MWWCQMRWASACALALASVILAVALYAPGAAAGAYRQLYVNTSKPLNEISFAMAHDSQTATPLPLSTLSNATEKALTAFAIDQTNSVTQMLDDGIRSLRINTCNLTRANTLGQFEGIYLCHGQWVEMFAAQVFLHTNLTVVFRTFEAYLTDVATWLAAHPDQIVFLFDEGDAGVHAVGPIYDAVLHGITQPFRVDVASTAFAWPTYDALVAANTRLIPLMSSSTAPDTAYPGLNRMWYSEDEQLGVAMQPPWDYYTPDQIRYLPTDSANGASGAGDVDAGLYLFNHCFYTNALDIYRARYGALIEVIIAIFAGKNFDFSDPTKNGWTVGAPLLAQNVWTAWSAKGANRRPNFVAADFYQGVDGTDTTLFTVVDQLNAHDALPASYHALLQPLPARASGAAADATARTVHLRV